MGSRRRIPYALAALAAIIAASSAGATPPGQSPPLNTSPPTISGSAIVGSTLNGSDGTWSGAGVKYSEQWMRCDSSGGNCSPIAGATSLSYGLGSADSGLTIRLAVVAANQRGTSTATSDPSAVVVAPTSLPPPTTTSGSSGSGSGSSGSDTTAPSTPTNLATTGNTTTSVALTWSASTDNVGVTGYAVSANGAPQGTTTATSFAVSGLTCGTTYTFGVQAFDAAGNHSAQASLTAATAACVTTTTSTTSPSVYWGAYIEGTQTYSYLYGDTWGNAPWSSATWDQFESDAGKKVSIEHYGQPPPWQQPFDANTANLVIARGAIPAIDISTQNVPLRDIAAGKYDSSITAWAQAAKAWGHPFFLLLDVEMNGTWAPYSVGVNGNTASDFVNAWRHMHDIFTQVGATNATWVWCPNVDPSGIFTPYDQLYPGDGYVDWTGLDGFNQTGNQSFSWLYGSSYQKLLSMAASKPIMISQIASVESGIGKAAWITDALSTQLPKYFPQVKALLWFNWRIYENNTWMSWEIESSASSQAAFAAAIASPFYAAGGSFGALPLLTKIKPL